MNRVIWMNKRVRKGGLDDQRVLRKKWSMLAALVESNGLIYVGTSRNNSYYPRLKIKFYVKGVIEPLKEVYGVGSFFVDNANDEKRMNFYAWTVYSKQCAELLRKILPYLVDNKRQAELCVELQEINNKRKKMGLMGGAGYKSFKGRRKLPPNYRGEGIRQEIKILNRKLRKKRRMM